MDNHTLHSLGGVLIVAAVLMAVACAALLVLVLVQVVPRVRSTLAGRRRGWAYTREAIMVEARARSMMSELCPHGWRAQITLFGPGDELPPDAPDDDRALVALDWAELERERRGVAVVRRVWAPTIAEALEAMVADRGTDEALEQIEQSAVPDGTLWPDLG
jgi:hypothetical protein